MTIYKDEFNGTLNQELPTYNSNWTRVRHTSNCLIINPSGKIKNTANINTSNVFEYRGLSTTAVDSEASIQVTYFPSVSIGDTQFGLVLRSDGTGDNHYVLYSQSNAGKYRTLTIAKRSSGSVADLSSSTATGIFTIGDIIKFRAVGTNPVVLTAYVNGSQVLTYSDSTSPLTSGALGISTYGDVDGTYYFEGEYWEGNDNYTSIVKKLKLLTHSSAASASGVSGIVFQYPTGGNVTGTEIGEFTGKTFEASLESGQAVLKVPVADFGGTSLTTSDTPVVLVRNSTNTTGVVTAQVIEE
jgi:hypothetical protein